MLGTSIVATSRLSFASIALVMNTLSIVDAELDASQARAPLRGAGGTTLRAGGALVGRGIWPKMGKAMPFSLTKMHKFRH